MTDISIAPAEGVWVVRAGGAVLGESRAALELVEPGHAPVIYFPRGDLAMAMFERGPRTTTCPHKGEASYYAIHTKSVVIDDAAWSYESPREEVAEIAGHLAFDPEKVTLERI